MSDNKKLKLAIISLALLAVILPQPSFSLSIDIKPPDPQISIPGLSKFKVEDLQVETDEEKCPEMAEGVITGCLFIPWVGQYIAALYKFAVAASTILATIVLMVAGYLWLTAAGNVTQIGTAKSYMTGAILGLLLMLGSYTILNLINPELVTFKSLRIPVVEHIDLSQYTQQITASGFDITGCTATNLNIPNPLVKAFNDAYTDFGVNPIVLASMAQAESSMGAPTQLESSAGAVGIMQITAATADNIWNNSPSSKIQRPVECSDANSPANNNWKYTDTCKNWMKTHHEENIRMGAFYFNMLSKQLTACGNPNNTSLVIAAYNAGPKNACNGNYKNFSETMNYLPRIKEYNASFCRTSGGAVPLSEKEQLEQLLEGGDSGPSRE